MARQKTKQKQIKKKKSGNSVDDKQIFILGKQLIYMWQPWPA